ncbi:TPA: hypothetical protein KQG29_001483 [Clostridioides difficile]|nr:hypothetical protein [Clostridioides difficile]
MKLLKFCIIICIVIFPILGFSSLEKSTENKIITTKCALNLVENEVPYEAKYEGYKKNQIDGTTILYYSYKNATHIVTLSHTENRFLRAFNWNEVYNIKYE